MGDMIGFFTDRQAARLAQISLRQLHHWRSSRVIHKPESDTVPLNTFRDVVALRTLAMVRTKLSLQNLRKLSEWLHERYTDPWSSIRFSLAGKELIFEEPNTGEHLSATKRGQKVVRFDVERVVEDVVSSVRKLKLRSPELVGKITATGAIAGTRISAAAIQNFAKEGFSVSQIRREYPSLHRKDVESALLHHSKKRTG